MALTYDQIDAHVQSKYLPVLVDQVFFSNPLLVKLMSKNKVLLDSGKSIRVPIIYGKKKGGAYAGLDKFDINPVKTRNLAEFGWAGYYVNITIVGDEFDMIEGDEKIIGLVESEVKEAELTMKDMLSKAILALNPGPKEMNSLAQAIDSDPNTAYGGIIPADLGDDGTKKIWTATEVSNVGSLTLSTIKQLIGECTYGTEKPDLIITTQAIYDKIWPLVQQNQRFLSPGSALAKAGFSGIQIDDTQIVVDRNCPAGYMFGINTDYFKFIIHKKKNFVWTKDKQFIDADAYCRQILFKGNLICTSRRYHFKAYGIS